MLIRNGTEADLPRCQDILDKSIRATGEYQNTDRFIRDQFRSVCMPLDTQSHFLIAYMGDDVYGWIKTIDNRIDAFYVDPEYHRQGIGKILYHELESKTKYPFLIVFSSHYAVSIYKRFGFVDRYPPKLFSSGIWMIKYLEFSDIQS